MTFHHTHDTEKGLFTAQEDTQQAGEVSYYHSGTHTLVLDHTQVAPAFQGRQLGQQLVDQVAGYARENGLKVVPQCPYAKKLFEKSDVYQDIWQHEA